MHVFRIALNSGTAIILFLNNCGVILPKLHPLMVYSLNAGNAALINNKLYAVIQVFWPPAVTTEKE